MPSLADIPLEVLIDNLLPYVPLRSITALSLVSKDLAALCSDDTFWKRKLQEDYNFSDASTARTSGGYKSLYRGFHRAKLYVWGSTGEGRLGLEPPRRARGILTGSRPYPMKLDVPGPRIVELVAGGWSFHALDAKGGVHVWGQLDGEGFGLNVDSFALPSKRVASPLKLGIPEKITHISCGRAHAAALSAAQRVWVFTAWGTPYVATAPVFASTRQVECGWNFVAVLTHAGEVYLWWPFDGEFGERTDGHMNLEEDDGPGEKDGVIQCQPWTVDSRPEQIRDVADQLPQLRGDDAPIGEKIVQIAAGDNFMIALTEGGHVLRADFHHGLESFSSIQGRPRWEYLPQFSDVQQVRAHPEFSPNNQHSLVAPDTMHITHISAHFRTFFAYSTGSSSIVLQGGADIPPEPALPIVVPALQNNGVISVVLGDYHFGALTSAGKLLTWGQYSSGALGLGDPTRLPTGAPGGYASDEQRDHAMRVRNPPPTVTQPAEVKFGTRAGGEGRKVFVFTTAAAGWHMGALVIDLEEGEDEDSDEGEDAPPFPGAFDPPIAGHPFPGRLPFRIGLAGARGRGRGRGQGGA